jgi:hypothetical protein
MSFAVYFPTDGLWLRKLLLRSLRRQVHVAGSGNLRDLALSFESASRDIAAQINSVASPKASRSEPTKWLLQVLSVGRAIIDLREEVRLLNGVDTTSTDLQSWMLDFKAMTRVIATLFQSMRADRYSDALSRITSLGEKAVVLSALPTLSDEERRLMSRARCLLGYLRDELQDTTSPLYEGLGQSNAR